MSIPVDIIIHLPGVVSESISPSTLGDGEVKHLTFDQWQRLDPAFPLAEKSFQQVQPTFWIGEVRCEAKSPDEIAVIAQAIANQVHTALLLTVKAPWLPTPILSAIYCRFVPPDQPGNAAVMRLIGPMEREWMVYGSELRVLLQSGDIEQAHRLYPYLATDTSHLRSPTVQAGLSVLQRTALPESWWGMPYKSSINEFLHCVAACENEIVPAESTVDITTNFGRQAATLLTAEQSEIKPLAKQLSQVYRLRTKLMHGRLSLNELDEEQRQLLAYPRRLLRTIVVVALLLELGETASLGDLLAIASTDPAAHSQLHTRLQSLA